MDAIYGKEKVRYIYNVVDVSNAIIPTTVDWEITDSELDNSDNSDIYTNVGLNYQPIKEYHSAGSVTTKAQIDFDDGWGNTRLHRTEIVVEPKVYEEPVLGFIWEPEEPTILDVVEFTQQHDDTRDSTLPKQYGRIDSVDVDHYNDGTYEEIGLADSDNSSYQFTTKQDDIPIKYIAKYWDGWQYQYVDLIKYLQMSNIPPEANFTREDLGICVPSYIYTATSTDLDDDDTTLVHDWQLYYFTDDAWSLVTTVLDADLFNYPMQYEGEYKLILRSTDIEGSWHEKEELLTIAFDSCVSGSGGTNGTFGSLRYLEWE